MRILLSTIGTRGDVQPLVALGSQLKALGQDVHFCVPPDFREQIESLGLSMITIGPELRSTAKASPAPTQQTPEQQRQLAIEGTVATQFETLMQAAQDCDLILGATTLQVAAPSVAEKLGIPYVFAAYCPCVLPADRHQPPVLTMLGDSPASGLTDFRESWLQEKQRWNMMWGCLLNRQREQLGLPPLEDVLSYILTPEPWLAADPSLGPWPEPETSVFQPGAWILPDQRPLPPELEAFLAAGEPPVYFGFGSIKAPQDLSLSMIQSARALGYRAILSRGWAELELLDETPDCLSIAEVNQQALFRRVAAVVHHGGAGTTTAAARAGAPQLLIPQHYDQFYWAQRVETLGIGSAHPFAVPDTASLTQALEQTLRPEVAERARSFADRIADNGAETAARSLIERWGSSEG